MISIRLSCSVRQPMTVSVCRRPIPLPPSSPSDDALDEVDGFFLAPEVPHRAENSGGSSCSSSSEHNITHNSGATQYLSATTEVRHNIYQAQLTCEMHIYNPHLRYDIVSLMIQQIYCYQSRYMYVKQVCVEYLAWALYAK